MRNFLLRLQHTPFSRFQIVIVFFVLCIAVILRFWKLGEIPIALNRDEASLGYTAYSILTTGKEEHGIAFPINIQSFGDWKLPLYVYLTIPSIAAFGLNEWSVRLPSALAGIAIVVLSVIVTRLLLEKEKQTPLIRWMPVVVGGFLAVNPWAVHLSRVAYEANVTLAFFLLGLTFFLMALQRNLSAERWMRKYLVWLFPLAALCFGITLFGYHSFQVFTPVMGFYLLYLYRDHLIDLFKHHKTVFFMSGVIVIACMMMVLIARSGSANATKFGGVSPFAEHRYREELFTKRQIVGELHPFLAKLYSNRATIYITSVTRNILTLWNPTFLFVGNSSNLHNISYIANFYLIEVLFVTVGLYTWVKSRVYWQKFLLAWLVIASLAPIITITPDHSIRFIPALVPLVIVSAFGAATLFRNTFQGNLLKRLSFVALSFVCVYSVFQFVITYFYIFPKMDVDRWPWHMKEITHTVMQSFDEKQIVRFQGEASSPYIYFLFYYPRTFSPIDQHITFYPPTDEGFVHVKQLRNLTFGEIEWDEDKKQSSIIYYVLEKKELKDFMDGDQRYKFIQEFSSEFSKDIWYLIKFTPDTL